MPNVHIFESSGEAYDLTQTDDNIKDGDVLVIPNEGIIGILFEAWPAAVVYSEDGPGKLHMVRWDVFLNSRPEKDYSESIRLAMDVAEADADITGNAHWATARESLREQGAHV